MGKGTIEKGTLYLTVSSLLFYISGYVIYFALSRMLDGAAEFGIYGLVISLATLINSVMVAGIQQTISKFISEKPENAKTILQNSFKFQLALGGTISILYFLSAPLLAALLNDLSLIPYLQLSALIVLFHPLFGAFLGYFNGLKRFARQARLYASYLILKPLLILGLVFLGFGLFGAIGGFVAASFLGFSISFLLSTADKPNSKPHFLPWQKIAAFSGPIILFYLALNTIQQIDIYFLKALLPATIADAQTGYYVAAHTISAIPYSLAYSLTFILFPLVSGTTFKKNLKKARFYITNALRYATLVVVPLALFVAIDASNILALLYPSDYAAGGPALSILAIGTAFFSWFFILAMVVAAAGEPKKATLFGALTLIASAILCMFLIPDYGMFGGALAASLAMFISAFTASGYVYKKFQTLVSPLSLFRIVVAGLLPAALFSYLQWPGLLLIPKFALFAAAYALLLLLIRELNKQDLNVVLNMIR